MSNVKKGTSSINIYQPVYISTQGILDVSSIVICISSFHYRLLILFESDQYWYSSENTNSVKPHFLKRKCFSFFEDTKNGPTIITMWPLNQWFPNVFWSRTICASGAVTAYHLVPGKRIYQISYDQKYGKAVLTQLRHEQNDCGKW